MERERVEYDEYSPTVMQPPPPREMYHQAAHPQYMSHHGGPPRDMYPRSSVAPEDNYHQHRSSAIRETDHTDYHSPHKASSRRALNAI